MLKEREDHLRLIDAALAEMPSVGDIHYGSFSDEHEDGPAKGWVIVARPENESVMLFSAVHSPDSDEEVLTSKMVLYWNDICECPPEQGDRWSYLERRAAAKAAEKATGGTFVKVLHRIWTPTRQLVVAIVAERGFHNSFQLVEVDRPEGGILRKQSPLASQKLRRPLTVLFQSRNQFVHNFAADLTVSGIRLAD